MLSSAKIYKVLYANQIIDEKSAFNFSFSRFWSEYYLYSKNACILPCSFIYGNDQRSINSYLARIKNGNKTINVINYLDIIKVLEYLISIAYQGQYLLLSENKCYRWHDIATCFDYQLPSLKIDSASKQLNNTKLQNLLPFKLRILLDQFL